jgi:uncharacterized membrane protein (UPF0127 family)
MRIINLRNNAVLANKARVANTYWSRLIGLLNRHSLEQGEALILKPSYSIHTLFMRFTIDVIFLDKTGRIIGALPLFRPFRISPIYPNSGVTIELPANTLKMTKTQVGDTIKILFD